MQIQPNVFCWHGISTQVEAGLSFYPKVLGWDIAPDSDGAPMFVAPGGAVAHLQPPEGPPNWCSYLSVAELDGATDKAVAAGGTLIVPPTPLPMGRFSIVAAPSGAVLGLYEPVASDAVAAPGPGSIHWVELQSTSLQTDLPWLTEAFGFAIKEEQMPMGPYHLLEIDGEARGGAMKSQAGVSAFVAWVQVAELTRTLDAVAAHGGRAVSPVITAAGVGDMAVVADPSGAVFGVIQPASA